MKENFEVALKATLMHEGFWSDHPEDPGGATMRGVTQRTYDGWRRTQGLNSRSVRHITEEELQAIYKEQYWDKVDGDRMPSGLDYALFDFAVNSGPARAVRYIQEIVGARADGIMGIQTRAAIASRKSSALVAALCDKRLAFVRGLSTWGTFGRGWQKRIDGVRKVGLQMASENPELPREEDLPTSNGTQKADGRDRPVSTTPEAVGSGFAALGLFMELVRNATALGDYESVRYVALGLIIVAAAVVGIRAVMRRKEEV